MIIEDDAAAESGLVQRPYNTGFSILTLQNPAN